MGRMANSICFFGCLLFFICSSFFHVTGGQIYYAFCPESSTYVANSSFDDNLVSLLSSSLSNISSAGFRNYTVGNGKDEIYGLVQCRGDTEVEVCRQCAYEAAIEIVQQCPYKSEAFIFLEFCLLRYSNAKFFGTASKTFIAVPSTVNVNHPDFTLPKPADRLIELQTFFQNLSALAIINQNQPLYAAGNFFDSGNNLTIFGALQCTQDLLPKRCNSCLGNAIDRIVKCCANKQGGRVVGRSCNLRFDIVPFFHLSQLSSPNDADAKPLLHKCSAASSNMTGTTFHKNLKVLLFRLVEYTSENDGFYFETVGGVSDQLVYGQAICRGDVSYADCWNCTSQASAKIVELCPSSTEAVIWFEHCQLHYSDSNFTQEVFYSNATANITESGPPPYETFDRDVTSFIDDLIYLPLRFSGRTFFTSARNASHSQKNYTIYALYQCLRDISISDCEQCLVDCQRAASDMNGEAKGAVILSERCRLQYGTEKFFFGDPTPIFNSGSPIYARTNRLLLKIVIIISATGGTIMTFIFLMVILRIRKGYLAKLRYDRDITLLYMRSPSGDESQGELPQISLKVLQDATSNFSVENELGRGGYGRVYKGRLPNDQLIAVKRLSETSRQGLNEFKNEANLIAKLQHKNLVRLLGCCMDKGEKLLIYECMPNKSLDAFLKDPAKRRTLKWDMRFKIITGTARGILYLHEDSQPSVIHRDLKAANVLLDERMYPKITDFGMARIFNENQSQANTGKIVGTLLVSSGK